MARYWNVRGRKVTFKHRSPNAPMGRFGGGWQWELGVQAGGSTVIFNLLVCTVRINFKRSMRVPSNPLGIEEMR